MVLKDEKPRLGQSYIETLHKAVLEIQDKLGLGTESKSKKTKSLDEMKASELREYAMDNNLQIDLKVNKDELLAAIKEAEKDKK